MAHPAGLANRWLRIAARISFSVMPPRGPPYRRTTVDGHSRRVGFSPPLWWGILCTFQALRPDHALLAIRESRYGEAAAGQTIRTGGVATRRPSPRRRWRGRCRTTGSAVAGVPERYRRVWGVACRNCCTRLPVVGCPVGNTGIWAWRRSCRSIQPDTAGKPRALTTINSLELLESLAIEDSDLATFLGDDGFVDQAPDDPRKGFRLDRQVPGYQLLGHG